MVLDSASAEINWQMVANDNAEKQARRKIALKSIQRSVNHHSFFLMNCSSLVVKINISRI
jgi:hypothetical protein